jgi:hypothetical protein
MQFKRVCLTLLATVGVAIAGSKPEVHQHAKRMDPTLKSQLYVLSNTQS